MSTNHLKLVKKSGNTLHTKVINVLREASWEVIVSPYYNDDTTDKPREIDIIAQKDYPEYSSFVTSNDSLFRLRLFVECKYVSDDVLIWSDPIDQYWAKKYLAGLYGQGMGEAYLNSKMFLTPEGINTQVTKIVESESLHKGLIQSIHSYQYYKSSYLGRPVNTDKTIQTSRLFLLVNSYEKIREINIPKLKDGKVKISDIQPVENHKTIEINYSYKGTNGRSEYFLVTLISLKDFKEFLINVAEKERRFGT